jgi:hypothetical protein
MAEEKAKAKKTTAKKDPDAKGVLGRRKKRKAGRDKRKVKIQTDKEFATKYHEAKSKRAGDKKVAFRKKKSAKK